MCGVGQFVVCPLLGSKKFLLVDISLLRENIFGFVVAVFVAFLLLISVLLEPLPFGGLLFCFLGGMVTARTETDRQAKGGRRGTLTRSGYSNPVPNK